MIKYNKLYYGILLVFFSILLISFSSAITLGTFKQGECIQLKQTCANCSFVNVTSVIYPNSSQSLGNSAMTKTGTEYNKTYCNTDVLGEYTYNTLGNPDGILVTQPVSFIITPSGKAIDNVGQISSTIVYFFLILGLGLIGLGFLLLRNDNIWTSYTGLFIMIIGSIFLYYDLHLTNLYASTIAVDSGASNTTGGIFVLVVKFLKVMPYFIILIIIFSVVRLLRETIKKRNSSDGWDNDKY